MKQNELGGTEEEGRNVEESGSPRSEAGGCSPNGNYLWKFHHHCSQTPVNLLLNYLSWLLFGTRPQGHWQGNMEMLSIHRKSGYRKFQITPGKCIVQWWMKGNHSINISFPFFDLGYNLQPLTLGNSQIHFEFNDYRHKIIRKKDENTTVV